MPNLYKVNEIFYSLQGEGFYVGTPAVFLRFSGCNLKCGFCDTDHSEFEECALHDIIEKVSAYPSRHIVITGGEPSLQINDALVDALHLAGFYIQVETNGTRHLPDDIDWVTCSPKGDAPVVLSRIDELKIVYLGQDVEGIASQYAAQNYFLQPCSGENTSDVVRYILAHPHWRLSLQTHKLIHIQ